MRRTIWGSLIFAGGILAIAACGENATTPAIPNRPSFESGSLGGHQGEVAYACTVYRQDHDGHGFRVWQKQVTLYFPRAEVPVTGATRLYRYRGYAAGPEPAVYADCAIPGTDAAVRRADRFFGVLRHAKDDASGVITTQECVRYDEEGACELAPVTGTACQYGGVYPGCGSQPVDNDYCGAEATCGGGSWGWNGGTGGGGGGGWTPADGDGSGEPPCVRDARRNCVLRPLFVVAKEGRPHSEWAQIGVLIGAIRDDVDYCAETKALLTALYDQGPTANRFQAWDGWNYDRVLGKYVHGQIAGDAQGTIVTVGSWWLWEDSEVLIHEGLHLYLNAHAPTTGLIPEGQDDDWIYAHQDGCVNQ